MNKHVKLVFGIVVAFVFTAGILLGTKYIKALEGRVRELTFDQKADRVDSEEGQTTAEEDDLDELTAAERQDEGDR